MVNALKTFFLKTFKAFFFRNFENLTTNERKIQFTELVDGLTGIVILKAVVVNKINLNPLNPKIKICYPYSFPREVVGRS